ncbi:hypothetical protein [uncultured Clostridium sp.]|uniref:hypothetical protein n=1 Tax=uncultured Clostridium sp. TaxID=59620 RepID=UPI0026EB7823|nr:hypothetical protein [uncultured Clostridium sp.]
MKLSKNKMEEIKKFERAAKIVHRLRVELGMFLEKKNIPHDVVCDEFESLLMGDMKSEDFINDVNDLLEYYND